MASDRCLAALRLSEGGSIRWMKTQKRHTELPFTRYYYSVLSFPLIRRDAYTPSPLFSCFWQLSSLSRSLSTSVVVPFTSTLDALSPHSVITFQPLLPRGPAGSSDFVDCHQLSLLMDRYQPTTNHPRERSLFINPRIIRAFLCLRLCVCSRASLDRPERTSTNPLLPLFSCLLAKGFPSRINTERSTTQYTLLEGERRTLWPVHARDTSCHCWQRARGCVCTLTELSRETVARRAPIRVCWLPCSPTSPSPSPSSSSSSSSVLSFVCSFVHRQTFYDQPTRSTPHPRYRCARSRSINALRRFHGGGRTKTAATASNGHGEGRREHTAAPRHLRTEGWRTDREGETKRG